MRTGSTLLPGRRGTRNLVKQYGAALLCVRYRYDADRRRRYKTVELIIDEAPWDPPPPPEPRIVRVTVAYEEAELRRRIKAAGGVWNPDGRVWELPDYVAVQLHRKSRIVTCGPHSRSCRWVQHGKGSDTSESIFSHLNVAYQPREGLTWI